MFRKMIPLATVLVMIGTSAIADDAFMISDDDESIISGTVIDYSFDRLMIESSGQEIYVNVDNLDIEEDLSEFLPVGSEIRVYGDLEDDEIEATRIIGSD